MQDSGSIEQSDLKHACWLISDGRAGHESIARGIADAMGLRVFLKPIAPRGLQKVLAPHWPVARAERFGVPGAPFAPPVPDAVMAIGRQTVPYLRMVKRAAPTTFAISLLNARVGFDVADVIWAPQHDGLTRPNVITTLTSPHRFSEAYLAQRRANPPPDLVAVRAPRIAVLLGGPSRSVHFDQQDTECFAATLRTFVQAVGERGLFAGGQAPGYLVTPSRRTPADLCDVVRGVTDGAPRLIYDGGEPNPYDDFIAAADALIVTGDSISMVSEAVATGRPVFVFRPRRLPAKFNRFLDALDQAGATRPFDLHAAQHAAWTPTAIDPTPEIARQILLRLDQHRCALGLSSLPGNTTSNITQSDA